MCLTAATQLTLACRYIQYESDLDELRKLRKDAMGLEGKRGLADTSMTKRIHFIYQRATQKFRGDLRLWSAWLQFCKDSNSMRKLSQVGIASQAQENASHRSGLPFSKERVVSTYTSELGVKPA